MRKLKHLWHVITGWHELPAGVLARITPRPDADTLDVKWGQDRVRITHEHDCEG
jgi:hypothetical protein